MAITFISAASANASSVAISTPQKGDLILVGAYNETSTTIPTLPAGYTSVTTNTNTTVAVRVASKISDGTETSVPAFTNATNIVVAIYRGVGKVGALSNASGNAATVTFNLVTLQVTDGSSWVVGLAENAGATAGMNGTTTAFVRNRSNQTTVAVLDTNAGVSSQAAQTLSVTGTGRYLGTAVELVVAPCDESTNDYWGANLATTVAKGVLALALAASMFTGSLAQATTQDREEIPAGHLFNFTPDEDFWINPVAPVPPTLTQQLPYAWFYHNDEPAGNLFGQADEDFWFNQVPPQPLVMQVPALWVDAAASDLPPPVVAEEDFWQNPVAPQLVPHSTIVVLGQSQAGSEVAPTVVEEDFWQSLVAPQQLVEQWFQQFAFEQHESEISFGLDEDYWQNPVAPWPLTEAWPQQFGFEQNDFVTQIDEEPWQNPVAPLAAKLAWPQPFAFDAGSAEFTSTFDEDYWQNPTSPIAASLAWPQQFTFDVQEPAGSLFGPEEELWQNQVKPQAASLNWVQPFSFDQNDFTSLVDEDFWQNAVVPVQASLQWPQPFIFDQQEDITVSVDEDFWVSGVAPQTLVETWPQPFSFEQNDTVSQVDEDFWQVPQPYVPVVRPIVFSDTDEVVTQLAADEDFWVNPVAPVPLTFIVPQQWTFDVQEPSGSLFGQPEEDFWLSGVAPVQASLIWPQQFQFEQPDSLTQEDEVYWLNPVAAVPPTLWQKLPYGLDWLDQDYTTFPTDEDFWSVPQLIPPVVVPKVFSDTDELPVLATDEDFGQPQLPPQQATLAWPQPFTFEQNDFITQVDEDFWQVPRPFVASVAPTVFSDTDDLIPEGPLGEEDYWQVPQPYVAISVPKVFSDTDELPVLVTDEDFWQNQVPPVAASLIIPQQAAFDSQEPALFRAEEEFWQNAVQPVASTFVWPQQFAFDTPEYVFTPEEEFWQNPVAPLTWANIWQQPSVFDVQEPAGSLFGQPDEDFWQNPVAPLPASLYQSLPYLPDREDVQFGVHATEEDFWQNPVAPVWWLNAYPQQASFDVQEPAGSLRTQVEEEFWQVLQAPQGWLIAWPQQWAFDQQEIVSVVDEDFWAVNAPWVVGQVYPQPFAFEQNETVSQVDEDLWQVIQVRQLAQVYPQPFAFDTPEFVSTVDEDFAVVVIPQAVSQVYPQPFSFDQAETIPKVDEDYAQVGPQPIAAALYQALPYLPDGQESSPQQNVVDEDAFPLSVPLASQSVLLQQFAFDQPEFFSVFDEDFWVLGPVPVVAPQIYPQPFGFDQSEFVSRVDEDFWTNPVPPVNSPSYYPQPFAFDQSEVISQFDEDFWSNPVGPLALVEQYPQPFNFDTPEISRSFTDEDFWQNPVKPVAASNYQPLPYLPDTEVDVVVFPLPPEEDFWINPVNPVPATLYQTLPYLPDPEVLFFPAPPGAIGLGRAVVYGEVEFFKAWAYPQAGVAAGSTRFEVSYFKAQTYPQVGLSAVRVRILQIGEFMVKVIV